MEDQLKELNNDPRKLRLFACACVREIWPFLTDERSRNAVEAAELFADGRCSQAQLGAAMGAAWAAVWSVASSAASAAAAWAAADQAAVIIKDLAQPEMALLVAIPSHILGLAEEIYDNRDTGLYPILADALEDWGQYKMADHCRQPDHWRGCWVIDLLTGKVKQKGPVDFSTEPSSSSQ